MMLVYILTETYYRENNTFENSFLFLFFTIFTWYFTVLVAREVLWCINFTYFFDLFFQRNKEVFVADFEFRERMFTSITDLITLAIFLGISPGVKEAMTAYLRGDDKKDLTPYKNFLKQTGKQFFRFRNLISKNLVKSLW